MKQRKILILSFLILIVLVLTHQVDRIDQLIYEKIQLIQTPLLTQIMIYLTNLGSGIFYAFVLILCFLFKRKETASLTLFMLMSCACGNLFKYLIQRPRPMAMLIREINYSFPSNHALNAIVFYWLFALCIYQKKDKVQKLLFVMPLIIGFTRIYLHVHYFSDVLGGFLLGVLLTNYYISLNKPTNMINYKRGGKCDEAEIKAVS